MIVHEKDKHGEKCRVTRFFLVGPYKLCRGFTASCPWARGLRCFLLLARYLTVKSFKVIVSFVLLNELYRWNTLSGHLGMNGCWPSVLIVGS